MPGRGDKIEFQRMMMSDEKQGGWDEDDHAEADYLRPLHPSRVWLNFAERPNQRDLNFIIEVWWILRLGNLTGGRSKQLVKASEEAGRLEQTLEKKLQENNQ